MKIQIADITNDSIVDGEGIRLTVFTQGCQHRCPGCHNPATHDTDGGREADTAEIISAAAQNPLLDGITLSGGEPFLQPAACAKIAAEAHAAGLNVWVYTGFTFEEILDSGNGEMLKLLNLADVLVDGRFVMELRSLNLKFRGSSNQRILDVKKSIESEAAIEYME